MLDLGFLLLLAAWAAGVGLFVLRRFGPTPDEPADAIALAVPIGLGVLALAALALGEIGELDAGRIEAVLGIGAVVAVPGVIRLALGSFRKNGEEKTQPERVDRAFGVVLATAAVGTLLTALAPVTDGDALCYHLQVPKRFLERGAVFYDADLHETVYPLLTEMLYAVALAFRGPVACRLVQWLLGVVFALNVTALARPSLGRRAWWAGAVAVLAPAVSNGMSAPLNDVALAAYGTAALFAWSRFRAHPTLPAAALTGLLTGLAMGVKYPALVLAGLIGVGVAPRFTSRLLFRVTARGVGLPLSGSRKLVERLTAGLDEDDEEKTRWQRWRNRRRLVHLVAFGAFAWGAGGVWYARAFFNTGNPVYPFFRDTFGGAGLDVVLGPEKRPLAVEPWNLLTALGPLTLEPDRFDSFSHQFGPVFLLFLPALLWERPPRRVLALAAIGYGFLMLCLTQRQSMRFLLIALGPMSVAVAWLASTWWERKTVPGRALVAALLLALGFESALAVARARHGLGVVVGAESADHYLARREPTFVVGRWVGANLPESARLVGQDHRGFYFPRDYTMELAHRRRTGLGRNGESAAEVVSGLRAVGFTHVLLCPPVPESAVEFDPTLGRILGPWLDARAPVYRADLTDGDGVVRRYAIYPLTDDRVASRGGSPAMKSERPTLVQLRARVQKGRHREIGNWLARRVARPTAVYGTWAAVRLGVSAHQVTCAALLSGLSGAAAVATGTRAGFVAGVALQLAAFWLDHVDGQVARWRGTSSLDGVYFDYLMHHASNLALGFALGYGLSARSGDPRWAAAGFAVAGWAGLSLHNDCRYKAFFQRLKRETSTTYRVDGGSGGRPGPPPPRPRRGLGALAWPAYKACEPHVVLLGLTALAAVAVFDSHAWLALWRAGVVSMAVIAPGLAVARAARAVKRGAAEDEFARWFKLVEEKTV